MDTTTILTFLGTIVATLGGKEAFGYYKKKLDLKTKLRLKGSNDESELQDEIKGLLESQIKELKEQVRLLTGRIKHMEEEREKDKKRIGNQEIKIALLNERLGGKFKLTRKKKED